MNPVLLQLARNRNRSKFITVYKSLFGGSDSDADLGYNAYVAHIRGGVSSPGGGSGYSPTPSGSGGGFSITEILSNLTKGLTNIVNVPLKFGAGISEQLYRTQLGQGTTTTGAFDDDTFLKYFEEFKKNGVSLQTILATVQVTEQEIYDQLRKESQLRSEINEKTTLTGELSEMLREDMIQSSIYAAKYGFSVKDLGDLYIGLVNNTAKFSLLNRQTLDDAAPIVRSFVGDMQTMSDTIATFEKVGIGANRTLKTIEEAGVRSMSLGLSGRKVVEQITGNIEKLNQYGFQNGIRGLETMVRKAYEFRMNMENVFTIADKVFDPEGALDLSANLQVLGGAIGDFADPIRLMYNATNNVEGLQESLIGAAQSLATYNTEQGRFEITGVNLRRAKAMADQLGISLQDLTKTAIGAAERSSAVGAIMSSGLKVSDEDKEFLLNMSRMEGGEMKIIIPESLAKQLNKPAEIALDKLDQNTANALIEYRKRMEEMDAKDIAMNQLTVTEQMGRDVDVIAAGLKVMVARQIRGVGEGLLGDEYKKLRDAISEESRNTVIKRGTVNYEANAKQFGGEIRKEATDLINDPGKYLKDKGSDVIEFLKKYTKDILGISKITKEEISDGVYGGMIKYNPSRKDGTASINIQTFEDRGYLSKDPNLS